MKHFAFYKQEVHRIIQLQMNTNFPPKKFKNSITKINNNLKRSLSWVEDKATDPEDIG